MIYNDVLEAMGRTPLIRLNRLVDPDMAQILVKYEGVNVGGSIKTRTAAKMIEEAEARGDIGPGSIIVEPTSGNQGIGLALVCAVKGYEARIIMPDSVSAERRKLVEHYGASVIVVHDEGDIGKAIDECIKIAERMAAEDKRVFVPEPDPEHIRFLSTAGPIALQPCPGKWPAGSSRRHSAGSIREETAEEA